jgi:hypothetical protein
VSKESGQLRRSPLRPDFGLGVNQKQALLQAWTDVSVLLKWNAREALMSTITTYPHVVKEASLPARLESHPRTRVAMIVMDYRARGLSPEEIVRHYPYLTLADVHAAMTYYHDHQEEIDTEIQNEIDQLKNGPDSNSSSAVWQKLKAKGLV